MTVPSFVIPANAGTQAQLPVGGRADWAPAFSLRLCFAAAGMTRVWTYGCHQRSQSVALPAQGDTFRRLQGDAFGHKATFSGGKATVFGPTATLFAAIPATLSKASTPCR